MLEFQLRLWFQVAALRPCVCTGSESQCYTRRLQYQEYDALVLAPYHTDQKLKSNTGSGGTLQSHFQLPVSLRFVSVAHLHGGRCSVRVKPSLEL